MNSNYISTESLYDSGAHLAHKSESWRSHKYIKRERAPGGGWRYWYPTDIGEGTSSAKGHVSGYTLGPKEVGLQYDYGNHKNMATTYRAPKNNRFDSYSQSKNRRLLRNADKASKIYQEGQSRNEADRKNRPADRSNKNLKWEPVKGRPVETKYDPNTGTITLRDPSIFETAAKDVSKAVGSAAKDVADYATKAVSDISTAAGGLYDEGKKFLRSLFSSPGDLKVSAEITKEKIR